MALWTKLWYYGQNYGTIPRIMELRFKKEKKPLPNTKKLWFILEKTMVIYQIIVLNKYIALEL